VTTGEYLTGIVELLIFVGALIFCAARVRARMFPDQLGAPARLIEAVLAVTFAVLVGQALGIVGLFSEAGLLVCALVLAGLATRIRLPGAAAADDEPARTETAFAPMAAAGVVAGLVLVKWGLITLPILDQGMSGFDTMQYHMPFAAGFAQSGSITSLHYFDPTYMSWFDPANAELVHAEAILLAGRDLFSPLMNLGWLALALLAAWCIGRPYGRGWLSVLATGPLFLAPIFLIRQPGQAMTDTPATALLLASGAILVAALDARNEGDRIRPGLTPYIVVAALAAGLALGTKANLLPEVFVLAVGAVAITVPGTRLRVAAIWALAILLTAGVWYIRNLVVAGNPLPWFNLGVGPISLPATDQIAVAFPGSKNYSVAHYLTDGAVWSDYLLPGLKIALGNVWPVLVALIGVGAAGPLVLRATPVQRLLAATALVGIVVYLLSPGTALGLEGQPRLFPTNVRYVLPALALALAVLPTPALMRQRIATASLAILAAIALVVNLLHETSGDYLGGAVLLTVLAALATVLVATWSSGRLRPLDASLLGAALLGIAVVLYWPQVRQYETNRYTAVWSQTHLTPVFRWAKGLSDARIALAGTQGAAFQYAYYGDDGSNRVVYVGDPGPRGSFNPIETCNAWRQAINAGNFDYVITSPTLNYRTLGYSFSPEESWTAPGVATQRVLHDGPVSVFRIKGDLSTDWCDTEGASFSGIAPMLR
jgi:hypothetical protein